LDHEDFTGESTGHAVPKRARRLILSATKRSLERKLKQPVQGFRAPYLHADPDLLLAVKDAGFAYDSSLYRSSKLRPPISELWHPELKDRKGKLMSGYFWPFMEGKRPMEDYLHALRKSREPYVVLSTHSWHSRQTVDRVLSGKEALEKTSKLSEILSTLQEKHEFVRPEPLLRIKKS
ncbi:MAG TPA: hypothetical protein VI874_05310, partial [Candidatus Norongarragalinales archaeon]|nr:hypothetical protein [Candidatus Norongarragalinales archaeon]